MTTKTSTTRSSATTAVYTPKTRLFDARPDRLDFRDVVYRPPLRSLPAVYPPEADVKRFIGSYVKAGLILDQGSEGACTGFGLACVANYLLWTRHIEAGLQTPFQAVSPRMFYELAKRYDEWPGTDYDGSSCRGALKGWHKHGVCSAASWPYAIDKQGSATFVQPAAEWQTDAGRRPLGVYYRIDKASVVDLQAAIINIGAVYVSGVVHDGWDALVTGGKPVTPSTHASLPTIGKVKDPKALGGHAFALVGFNERGFVVQNSWGVVWGASGFGVLPYEDWIEHGTDAWACALGVHVVLPGVKGKDGTRAVTASRWRVSGGRSLNNHGAASKAPTQSQGSSGGRVQGNPADDPWPVNHEFACKRYQPWSTDEAHQHTLVMASDGQLVVTDFARAATDTAGFAAAMVVDAVSAWAAHQKAAKALKVMLYADGGAESDTDTTRRVRVLGPYFEGNGIYPIFITWKTGAAYTLDELVPEWHRKLFGDAAEPAAREAHGEAADRAIEALAHVMGRGVWSEMQSAAAASRQRGGALDLLVRNLAALSSALATDPALRHERLELHAVGDSTGAVLIGHLLSAMAAATHGPLRVQTCHLHAPACSVRFAVEHYLKAADAGCLDLRRLWLTVLSDANEKRGGMPQAQGRGGDSGKTGPGYGKSLLYLASRALHEERKMPLLGMERALDARFANADQWAASELKTLQQWQARWPHKPAVATGASLEIITRPRVRTTIDDDQGQATHDSFAHNVDVCTKALVRIKTAPLIGAVEWLDY